MSTWADVQKDDTVEGTMNSLWRVVTIEDSAEGRDVTLQNVGTLTLAKSTVPADKSVVIAVQASQVFDFAKALVQVELGGVEMAYKNETGRWMTPVAFADPGSLRAHFRIFHNQSGGHADLTLGQLEQAHHLLHNAPGDLPTDHVHDPDYAKGRPQIEPATPTTPFREA